MRLKFLQTAPSSNPDAPFQAGQILTVETLSPEMRAALTAQPDGSVSAVLLSDEAPEAAVVADDERAVLPRAKARKS